MSTEPRRICCFCETWESGGIESFLNNVLLHMDLIDIEVDIVAACIKPSVFTEKLEAKNIRFVQLSGKVRSVTNHRIFRNLVREKKYDVIHFNLFQGLSLYYVQIAKEEQIPVRIAHSHNTALRKSAGRWIKMLFHKCGSALYASAATDFWACSATAAKFLFPKKNYRFIPNGIDVERFKFNQTIRDEVRTNLGLSDTFVIGNVGRLCYQKNQEFLLDVLVELQKLKPESRLLLIGTGEMESYLKEKAARLGISEKVVFYGTSDNVERLMCSMDVFVFPSHFEGLGIVAVEAQASGLPVLCSKKVPCEAHIAETVDVLPFSPQLWAKGIADKQGEICDRSSAAMQIRRAGFGIDEVANRIFDIYMER